MSKSEDRRGKRGQNIAKSCLSRIGVEMVEKIGTPTRCIPVSPALTKQGIYRVIYEESVSGDHRGILPGGISVLAETKTIYDRKLRWSDLRDHQPERLQEHHDHEGISLLVWVNGETYDDVYIMTWPIYGFGPRKSIALDLARFEHGITLQIINSIRKKEKILPAE